MCGDAVHDHPLVKDDSEVSRDSAGVVRDVDEHLVRLAIVYHRNIQ
jgi:hypothetical protein